MIRTKVLRGLVAAGVLALCLASTCPRQTQNTSGSDFTSNNSTNSNSTNSTSNGVKYKAVLPEALTPDISEFSEEAAPSPANRIAGQPADHICDLGNGVIIKAHRHLDLALARIVAKLNADLIASGTTDGHLAGTYVGEHGTGAYKADFSAFDIDGDGTPDGSGDPRTLPVALRLWVDPENDGTFVRLLCALITAFPSVVHTGAGQIYIQPSVTSSEADATFHLHIQWDHTDPANKFNEAFLSGVLGDNLVVGNGHIRVDLTTLSDSSVQKTLQSVTTFTGDAIAIREFDYAARTLQGLGFATVKGKASGPALSGEFTACIALDHCTLSVLGCQTIDSAGLNFLPAPTGTETDFPVDFPATPTF
jgi:hypothetical protein